MKSKLHEFSSIPYSFTCLNSSFLNRLLQAVAIPRRNGFNQLQYEAELIRPWFLDKYEDASRKEISRLQGDLSVLHSGGISDR